MEYKQKYAIVVIGYIHTKIIKKLLERLNQVNYQNDEVLLIISIDKSDTEDVWKLAESFQWEHGPKEIKRQEKHLGLKDHVLKCGSYMEEYDLNAIAVFEDDMYPSLAFYDYMKQSVAYYQNDERIAGISLYAFIMNNGCLFQPDYNGYDTYFMRYAQSRGQIWMRKQWGDFIKWYDVHKEKISELENVPINIRNWPESSWLKYHITYCVIENKYFVYPYQALSTCFGELGTHIKTSTNIFHVPIINGLSKNYFFQPLTDNLVSYDIYFEREQVGEWMGIPSEELCVDLYGLKGNEEKKRYWLTMKALPYKIVRSYGLEMRPHEINILENIPGKTICLYDTWEKDKKIRQLDEIDSVRYYNQLIRGIVWYIKQAIILLVKKIK